MLYLIVLINVKWPWITLLHVFEKPVNSGGKNHGTSSLPNNNYWAFYLIKYH